MTLAHLSAAHWPAVSALLDEALALPADQRERFVLALDGERAAHRDSLRQLLARSTGMERDDFLDTLPPLTAVDARGALTELAEGESIGPYRLLREIGSGGMGAVCLAERVDGAMKRQVALKLPRLAWGRGLAERMARERDILATLEHPHIARPYDAGVERHGRPYLALEYVEGEPIDVYARQRQLGVRARLDLLLQVCAAVAFAHSRLVVHRDLKPSNILVTHDAQVRLLDFGIAKLMEGDVTRETQLTQLAGRALTLDYASPEQIRGEPIGTASDVYSLGVVAYELLTGARPYRLKRGTAAELEEAIASADAPRSRPESMPGRAGVRPRSRPRWRSSSAARPNRRAIASAPRPSVRCRKARARLAPRRPSGAPPRLPPPRRAVPPRWRRRRSARRPRPTTSTASRSTCWRAWPPSRVPAARLRAPPWPRRCAPNSRVQRPIPRPGRARWPPCTVRWPRSSTTCSNRRCSCSRRRRNWPTCTSRARRRKRGARRIASWHWPTCDAGASTRLRQAELGLAVLTEPLSDAERVLAGRLNRAIGRYRYMQGNVELALRASSAAVAHFDRLPAAQLSASANYFGSAVADHASNLAAQGRDAEAEQWLQRIDRLFLNRSGISEADRADIEVARGRLRLETGQPQRAADAFRAAGRLYEPQFGSGGANAATMDTMVIEALVADGRFDEARAILQRWESVNVRPLLMEAARVFVKHDDHAGGAQALDRIEADKSYLQASAARAIFAETYRGEWLLAAGETGRAVELLRAVQASAQRDLAGHIAGSAGSRCRWPRRFWSTAIRAQRVPCWRACARPLRAARGRRWRRRIRQSSCGAVRMRLPPWHSRRGTRPMPWLDCRRSPSRAPSASSCWRSSTWAADCWCSDGSTRRRSRSQPRRNSPRACTPTRLCARGRRPGWAWHWHARVGATRPHSGSRSSNRRRPWRGRLRRCARRSASCATHFVRRSKPPRRRPRAASGRDRGPAHVRIGRDPPYSGQGGRLTAPSVSETGGAMDKRDHATDCCDAGAAVRRGALLVLLGAALAGCGGEGQNPLPEAAPARAAQSEELPAPPRIAVQPQPLVVADGEPAMFAVQVQGRGPLRYQWQREGADIAGAQGAVLVIAAAQRADDGVRFTVVVQGPGGQARSEPIQLHVETAGTATRF